MTDRRDQANTIHYGLVTTIIPVYNRPRLIRDAVESVLAQSYQSLQIIIVDDGSTDKTPKVLRRLARRDKNITVLRQENQGPGVARQLGMQHANGEYIQFLDSDDLLLPDKFRQQVSALKVDRDAVAAYGKTELCALDAEPIGQAWKRTGQKIDTMFPLFLNERWWGTSTPLYRHRALQNLGAILPLINEEDWEFDCRLAARGGKLVYVDEFVSIQRRHDEHLSANGGSDKNKLRDRCIARQAMYNSARKSRIPIPAADMYTFSRAAFLLARECAAAGMAEQVKAMLKLSINANNGPTVEHRRFVKAGNFFGWRLTALLARLYRKLNPA